MTSELMTSKSVGKQKLLTRVKYLCTLCFVLGLKVYNQGSVFRVAWVRSPLFPV